MKLSNENEKGFRSEASKPFRKSKAFSKSLEKPKVFQKIAISATEDDKVDMRFGRCPKFKIVEIEKKEIKSEKTIDNSAATQAGGAGIQAAQLVGNEKVEAVITGNVGPNAITTLKQLGIGVYQGSGDIKEVINDFLKGKLKKLEDPTTGSHGGMTK